MSNDGRLRSPLAIVRALLVVLGTIGLDSAGMPADAEEAPAARASSETWTDPPARSGTSTSPTPAAATPAIEEARPAAPVRAERTPHRGEAAEPRAQRSAKLGRERVRLAARRARVERQAQAAPPRHGTARRLAERAEPSRRAMPERRTARTATRSRAPRSVYGYADPEFPAYGPRRAGSLAGYDWEEDAIDARAERIARARAAGFLVMRARTYTYPDGAVVRRLTPLYGFEPD